VSTLPDPFFHCGYLGTKLWKQVLIHLTMLTLLNVGIENGGELEYVFNFCIVKCRCLNDGVLIFGYSLVPQGFDDVRYRKKNIQ